MKKRILVAAASVVLAALILLLLPPAYPEEGTGTVSTAPGTSFPSTADQTEPTTQPEAPGAVRLYSCDDGFLEVFTELAAEYTALTGVEVTVLCPEADGCQATLQRYMESEDPPTVFCVHSQSQLEGWKDTLLDLKDTPLAAALCSDSFGLRVNGKLLGVPAAVQAYGLLVNAELLGTKGALSRNDITDLSSLTTAVQILKNNSVKAFPTTALTVTDALYLLQGEDLQTARAFIDLYLSGCSASGDSLELFLDGKAAFYLGGTWDYDTLAAYTDRTFHVRNLDILPTYAAGALQYICSTAWCINSSARQADIDAALDFMTWLVTAGEGTAAPVDRLQTVAPFADAAWYGNQLEKKLRGYMQTEAAVLHWQGTDSNGSRLLVTLNAYMTDSTDENWDLLCTTVNMRRAD